MIISLYLSVLIIDLKIFLLLNLESIGKSKKKKLNRKVYTRIPRKNKNCLYLTSRQPSNAGGFRMVAFTKPASDDGKENKQQVNPALRLPAERYAQGG